jgi:hypothetical protein
LCQRLEWDETIIIDGFISEKILKDKIEYYKTQGVGLLSWENISYEDWLFKINTIFGEFIPKKESLDIRQSPILMTVNYLNSLFEILDTKEKFW